MKRLLPAPLVSLALFLGWLLLAASVSPGNLVLGAVLAVVIPWFTEPLRPERPRPRAWGTAARLTLVVLYDIVMSAWTVARQILGPQAQLCPQFVWVPLDLRDPHGIVLLASAITLTPGTLSADLTEDRRHLLVHALHVDDEAALIDSIKQRYESPLRAIFDGEPA
jgi:multicomponent K+:H+ antiporter subunit E